MAVEYDNDTEEMTMICDTCGEEETFEGDWHDCIQQAKDAGWRISKQQFKPGGPVTWVHSCPVDAELERSEH